MNRKLRLMRRFMKGQFIRYFAAILAMAASVGISFLTPLVLAETIDAIIGQKRPIALPEPLFGWVNQMGGRDFLLNNLWIMALCLLLLNLLGGAFQYLRGRMTAQASETIAKGMRDQLYSHIQTLPYDYHVKVMTGDLIQRCTSDVETIRRFLAAQLVEIFRTLLMIVIALTVMLRMNARMTGVSMILVPPLFLFAYLFFSFVQKAFRISDEAEARMSAVLQENLSGVRVVRAFAREQYEVEKFAQVNDSLRRKNARLCDLLAIYWPGSDMLSMLQSGVTLIFGVYLAARGEMLVGEMTVFVSYISMLLWPIRQLGRILSDLGKSMVSLSRLDEILCLKPETEDGDVFDAPLDRDIEFRHVGFSYDASNPVLKDISFTVKRGQTVAILGATGSGKSTLMLLLQRLYDVKSGEILIGGVNINKIRKAYLRQHVGLILQEPFLYSRTVSENVAIVKPDIDHAQIEEAAETASAHGFISEFEHGYDTMVGERGVTLSGGQKQRVAIARTLLKDNKILVFDDSLSAVDTQTDQAIRAALKKKNQGVTTFIISHRLTTLSAADKIIVLEDGRVAQEGTHAQLIAQDGLYRRIYNIQGALEEELRGEQAV